MTQNPLYNESDADRIARQFKLEIQAQEQGSARLYERTREMEQRTYASGTVWGRSTINQEIQKIVDFIEENKRKLQQGKAIEGLSLIHI